MKWNIKDGVMVFGIAFFILLGLFAIVAIEVQAAPWANLNSNYSINITVVPINGDNITDIQVLVNLTNLTGMRSECQDVNFTWLNVSNNVEYSINSWLYYNRSNECRFWGNVPVLYSSGINTTLVAYFNGTYTRNDVGGAALVGVFGDDFEDGTIGSAWIKQSGLAAYYHNVNLQANVPIWVNSEVEVRIDPGDGGEIPAYTQCDSNNAEANGSFMITAPGFFCGPGIDTIFGASSGVSQWVYWSKNKTKSYRNLNGDLYNISAFPSGNLNLSVFVNGTTQWYYPNRTLADNYTQAFVAKTFIGTVGFGTADVCVVGLSGCTLWKYVFGHKGPENSTEYQAPLSNIIYSSRNSFNDATAPSFNQTNYQLSTIFPCGTNITRINLTDNYFASLIRISTNDTRISVISDGLTGSTAFFNLSASINSSMVGQTFRVNVTINDTSGNRNWTEYNLTVVADDTIPTLNQTEFTINRSYHLTGFVARFNMTDGCSLDTLQLTVNDTRVSIVTDTTSGLTRFFNLTASSNVSMIGQRLRINLSVNDTNGNKNWSTLNFTIFDGLVPFSANYTIDPIETSIALNQQNVTFTVDTADHDNASSISVLFEISGAIAAVNVSGVFQSGNRYNLTYRPLALGIYNIHVWVNDSATNANKTFGSSFETIIQTSGGGSSGGGSVSLPSAAIVPSNITMTTDKGSKTYSFVLVPSANRKRLLVFRNFGREREVKLECRSLTKNISLCNGVKFEKVEFTPKLGGLISTLEVEISAPEVPGKYQLELLAKTYEENGPVAAVGVDMEVSAKGYLFEVLDFTFNQSFAGIPNFLIMMFVLFPLALLALASLTKRRKKR